MPATTSRTSRMRHSQERGERQRETRNPSEMVRRSSTSVKTTVRGLATTKSGRRRRRMSEAQQPGTTRLPQGGGRASGAGSRLDRWVDSYASRTRGMTASEIRALFGVASRPEVVSPAGGMPYLSALPLDVVGEAIARLVAERGTVALQYGSGQGDPKLRERILDVMAPQQVEAHPDDVVVTTGSQQALDLVTRIFVDPGDVVLAEAPSYVGALGVFRAYQADVVHVPLDDDGLDPDALEETLTRLAAQGRRG